MMTATDKDNDDRIRRDSVSVVDYSHQPDPAHGSSNITVATFNLVATIVGGGVLSLPFAFSKCGGALYGLAWMLLAAICTDQSCVWLCWCARPVITTTSDDPDLQHRLMLSSYGQVGKAAFGDILEVAISALLFVFLVFVLIAYMVLVKDIWTPLIIRLFLHSQQTDIQSATVSQAQRDAYWGPYVLLAIVLFMTPFLVQRTLHALRFNCYIGFASVSILCIALVQHALQQETSSTHNNILLTRDFWTRPPESARDVIIAFPIIMLSYLCHFNVNPVQKALVDPTPARVHQVIHGAMLACGVLMTVFGIAGYAYVLGADNAENAVVQGNILLNCEEQQERIGQVDVILLLGRLGCGTTIMLAMAMMLLPCRDSLLEVLDIFFFRNDNPPTADNNTNKDHPHEMSPLVFPDNDCSKTPPPSLSDNEWVHYTATVLIVAVCYVTAVKVPGVQIVWSLCGSSMAFTIAFILPAACYLQMIHRREAEQQEPMVSLPSKILAWIVLIVSILAAIVCTIQTIQSI
ncbi:Sodium-coupled neutral amino acid transporter 5 [Seminavis robusta]|uniref:Sodium-coupled neutral amino acid transporter 5 n=1 Tax=Seminavis robusta TaxID=568900 RepID=A0A9N8H3E8_9STRA|nr:Sodium-coupled neutral amino acid transporter 5 [Seminavis robusta]|eukprot:Sro25_g016980.1 Sodium-coupled neutral amino acid transporter 5 (519) ;mRNA; f:85437-86993